MQFQRCELLNPVKTKDAYNKPVISYTLDKYIDCFISTRAGNTQVTNNQQITSSTHIGLTPVKGIGTSQRIALNGITYQIDFVIDDGRLSQLFLKAVQ